MEAITDSPPQGYGDTLMGEDSRGVKHRACYISIVNTPDGISLVHFRLTRVPRTATDTANTVEKKSAPIIILCCMDSETKTVNM